MTDIPSNDFSSAVVYIVDDEESVRTSIKRYLLSQGYDSKSFASADAFLEHSTCQNTPCCLILDLQMPEMSGLELQSRLVERGDHTPIVFLTAYGDVPTSVTAMKQGAEDYLPKMSEPDVLLEAVKKALAKSADLLQANLAISACEQKANQLSTRELQVCRYVVAGLANKQIARKMDISERTVKAHRAKVMQKLEVESVPDLVRVCQQAGIQPEAKN